MYLLSIYEYGLLVIGHKKATFLIHVHLAGSVLISFTLCRCILALLCLLLLLGGLLLRLVLRSLGARRRLTRLRLVDAVRENCNKLVS